MPTARAGPVTRQSFLAVVTESCIVVEHLGNRARPLLHQAHPMVTAERPARRHDGRWHLCIFSFLLRWIKSWKRGADTEQAEHNSPDCAHHCGDGAAGMFGSPACQNPLCERNCRFCSCWALQPAVWMDWAGGSQPGHLREAELCLGAHPGLLLEGQAGWWPQLVLRGEMGSGAAGQPPGISLCLRSKETFDDPYSQGPCDTYRQISVGFDACPRPKSRLLQSSRGVLQESLAKPAAGRACLNGPCTWVQGGM